MSAEEGMSPPPAPGEISRKALLAFTQALLLAPTGMRIWLPVLDDTALQAIVSVFGAKKRIHYSTDTGRCVDKIAWEVDGHRFEASSDWRHPTVADWTRIRDQEHNADGGD